MPSIMALFSQSDILVTLCKRLSTLDIVRVGATRKEHHGYTLGI